MITLDTEQMERIIDPSAKKEEKENEKSLRPLHFEDYVGQDEIKMNLKVIIAAAKARGEALDHLLFYGPPGLGKTTLAGIIANEMGVGIKTMTGPAIERPGDIVAMLKSLKKDDILFIDEIHRLNRQVEEVLYPAMEDFRLDILIGRGADARSFKINLPRFTLIGATTRGGMLSAPLRDRFGMINHLEFYRPQDLAEIVKRSAAKLDVDLDEEGAMEIARRSRGTPRLANRLLKRARDFAQVQFDGKVTRKVACVALDALKVDPCGLDVMDRKLLMTLMETYGGGPAGLDTLAASIGEDVGTIEDMCEPYLMQQGFLQRTPRGRVVTPKCYEYFHVNMPSDNSEIVKSGKSGKKEPDNELQIRLYES